MAGVNDPREEEVTPLEPDFSVTSDSGEVGAIYELTILSLFEAFYTDIQELPPEEMYSTIDDRTQQLYNDIEAVIIAMVPAIALIGAADALSDILSKLVKDGHDLSDTHKTSILEFIEKKTKISTDYSIKEQKLTAKAITDEIKNDLKTGSFYTMHRLKREPNAKVKSGNIVRKGVFRAKKMSIHGVMSSYHSGKEAYYGAIFTPETEYYWITKHDPLVCPFCAYFELTGPFTLDTLPPCPYHIHCRCTYRPTESAVFRNYFTKFIYKLFKH